MAQLGSERPDLVLFRTVVILTTEVAVMLTRVNKSNQIPVTA